MPRWLAVSPAKGKRRSAIIAWIILRSWDAPAQKRDRNHAARERVLLAGPAGKGDLSAGTVRTISVPQDAQERRVVESLLPRPLPKRLARRHHPRIPEGAYSSSLLMKSPAPPRTLSLLSTVPCRSKVERIPSQSRSPTARATNFEPAPDPLAVYW